MNKLMTSLSTALLVSLAGCEHAKGPQAAASHLRQQADPARERVWRLDRDGVSVLDHAAPAKRVRLEGWLWVAPPYACAPDLALGPNGEAVITSNVVPVMWRIDPETLAVTVHPLSLDADTDKDIGFSSLVYSPEQEAFIGVSDAYRTTWRIDAQLTAARKIPPQEVALFTAKINGGITCAIN
jgi:hypothetical protein